jgi:microcystin-dependent protein
MAGEIKLNNVSIATESGGTVTLNNSTVGVAPIGSIQSFGMTTPTSGWLVCNGGAISQSTYSALYAVVGKTWIPNWSNGESITTGNYRLALSNGAVYIATSTGTTSGSDIADDSGVNWSASSNFLLPDLRGEFLRGFDNGRGADPEASTRLFKGDAVGSAQMGQTSGVIKMGAFYGGGPSETSDYTLPVGEWGAQIRTGNSTGTVFWLRLARYAEKNEYTTTKTYRQETRGRNKAVQYCIKY